MPRLSIIVPIYKVEPFVRECLQSLADQSFTDLEVVMVDDGSPDASADVAVEFERRDSRFRLIRQENAGLGAARNKGIAHMDPAAEFLAFVDSDDIVPTEAYRLMIEALDASGSDFVTGNAHHVNSARTWQVPMLRMLAREDLRRTSIRELSSLIADRIACNKVFRRSFWERNGLSFPEGMLHEDIPVVLRAHYLAEAVDVVAEPCYLWRLRTLAGEQSITQRRGEPAAIRGRGAAVLSVSRFLAERPEPEFAEYKAQYDLSVLKDDFRSYLMLLPDAGEEYRQAFMEETGRFLDQVDCRAVLPRLGLRAREQWLAVRAGSLDALLASLEAASRNTPVQVRGFWRRRAHFPELTRTGRVPAKLLRLDKELRFHNAARTVEWSDGKLLIRADAWISMVDAPTRRSQVKMAYLHRAGSKRPLPLPVRQVYQPERTARSGGYGHTYDWAGYELVLDPRKLKTNGRWAEGTWQLGIAVAAPGVFRRGPIRTESKGHPAGTPEPRWVDEHHRVRVYAVDNRLYVDVERVRAHVTGYRLDGEHLLVEGEFREPLPAGAHAALRLRVADSDATTDYPVETADRSFAVRLPLAEIAPNQYAEPAPDEETAGRHHVWATRLIITRADGSQHDCAAVLPDGLTGAEFPLPRGEIAVTSRHTGELKLWSRPPHAVLTRLTWTPDGELRLAGRTLHHLERPQLVLRSTGRAEEKVLPARYVREDDGSGRFEAAVSPAQVPTAAGLLPLRTGRWRLLLRCAATGLDLHVKIDRTAVREVDQTPVESGGRRFQTEIHHYDTPEVFSHSELELSERGAYRQLQLQRQVYAPLRDTPLRESVVYFSYNGKQYSDSPRAIHEELVRREEDLEHLWTVRDGQVKLPASTAPLPMWGTKWYEALATSRYVVTNAHLPDWFRRREGQIVVQTWHGTMLKKIGFDIAKPQFDRLYRDKLRRETGNWSLLVSANSFSTPILKRAFGFDGEILQAGYPRNDCLYAADRAERAAEIKERLGLPQDKKVVLYAPTWRDDLTHGGGNFKFDLRLDLAEARRRLGDSHVLLVRRHSNVVDSVPGAGEGFVYDVSEYPDIADLYLVSDVLITDYSSAMFDYANLGRPMLFFTYDLEHYRDTLRGFYFDFEADAPGPLLATSDAVLGALLDIEAVKEKYADSAARFRRRFCDFGDGAAAQRVVDRMLELGAQPPKTMSRT
ncbi:CDP-glycerol glycerophosphotransferase family protein [Streptomyces sp. KLOTTS4A1]|uniref:bifunctional glycosyltransferase/CDP-glycerol:glycerophosphate glycerophosphotransferase n=1 Tax=Streptomyces sp. KLOTTS4A1 TaxID=3390996 RepID=UPI0039F625AA